MFFSNIRDDRKANNKTINLAGFRTLTVYRFGRWRMSVQPRFLRAGLSLIYRMMERHVRFKYGIELPYTVQLGKGVVFEHQHGIVIHGNTKIGDGCIIRQGVTIGNKSLDSPFDAPVIGNYVNIGAGAKILGKVTIGHHASIGANAVVIHDIPDYAVAVGIPAKVIKIKSEVRINE
ncbi:serine O-acetyltransferase [Methylophaga sulfidovorans]|uniref:Serine acetyltransferase n=1 Tax=Methylophaga sulfidovorans TaxID=45496 RepID=A0A1I3XPJ6_9GAMM|nr:serine O-acetyltransferase [Methylophaga sulfidovorans]SFK20906.1 serine O-acetyltransferase [Methylophaga sulfidovorans]